MADVITRFKLETTQYDSKLRDASKGLAEYTRQATQAGNEFGKFTQKNIEAARALGSITPSANNAKDKVKELVGAFNDAARAYNALTKEQQQSDFGKAMAESLGQLSQQLKEAKKELYDMGDAVKNAGGGGLFGGLSDKMSGALQVFAGNMLTKAAGAVAGLGTEIAGMVQQGVALAQQGEGIRIAFERLGRGDILQGLREATHGTVTDLELMKAAVKFNDFKLPLDELGTMLAFAQQKAKDTGQSVDYMVDSIVTGLGRKSLMILDNLGLSANEVKEKMKETGDMTKAVGEIIREQMSKAGDYVETAADRAAQAHVSLQNKMEELGRKFSPLQEASNNFWTSMKIGILDIVGGPLTRLLNGLTEAGRLQNMLKNMNGEPGSGNTKVDQQLKKLNVIKKGGGSDYIFNSTLNGMMEDYNRQIMALDAQIKNGGKRPGAGSGESQDVRYLQQKMDALKIMRDQLAAGAKEINKPIKIESNIPNVTVGGGRSGGGGGNDKEFDISSIAFDNNKALLSAVKGTDEGPSEIWKAITQGAKESTNAVEQLTDAFEALNKAKGDANTGEIAKDGKVVKGSFNDAAGAVGSLGSALAGLDDPAAKIAGVIAQSIANVALAFSSAQLKDGESGNVWYWIAAVAAGAAAMVSTIATIHSATGYARGGVIKAANGAAIPGTFTVPGTTYSNDQIPAMLNAGETVLTRAQAGNIASQLQGAGGSINLNGVLTGENIFLSADRYARRSGRGELVTFHR